MEQDPWRPVRALLARRARAQGFYRALHGFDARVLPRFHLDRYGPLWIGTFLAPLPDPSRDAANQLAALLRADSDGVVWRWRDDAHKERMLAHVAAGTAPERLWVEHAGYRFEARPLDPIDPGAYPDTEPLREALAAEAPGKRVLNLFAFTCLNGVVARLAGARSVLNVDLARSHLERGKDNYRRNELSVDDRDFVAADALKWCKKAERGRWDLIVVDPPPFLREGRGHVASEERLEATLASVLPLAAKGATIHFLQCTARLSVGELAERVRAPCPGEQVSVSAPSREDLDARELAPTFKDAVIYIQD